LEETALQEIAEESTEPVIDEKEQGTAEGKEEKVEKPKENRYSKRVKDLNTKYRTEERARIAAEKELAEIKESKKLKKEPQPEDFEDGIVPESKKKQWANQTREEIRAEERENLKKESKFKKQQKIIDEGKKAYIKGRSAYVNEDPEFHKYEVEIDDIVEEYQAPEIQNIILKSKKGLEIVKHFGKNPDDLLDIASSSPADRVYKMGQLTGKLQAKPVKKSSSAPSPTRSEKGSATSTSLGKNDPRGKNESWSDFCKRKNG